MLRFHHQPAARLASLGFRTGIRFATVSRLCPIPNNTVGGHIADLISHTRYVFSHAPPRVDRGRRKTGEINIPRRRQKLNSTKISIPKEIRETRQMSYTPLYIIHMDMYFAHIYFVVVVVIIHSGSSPYTGPRTSISHVQTVCMRSTERRKHSVAGQQLYNNNKCLHFLQDFARGVPDRKRRLRDDCRCVMLTILPQRWNTRYVTAVGFYFFCRR